MRDTSIVSPGILSNGYTLRREAAKAISTIEIAARATSGGKTAAAAKLSAFFADCVTKLTDYVEVVLPTVSTYVRNTNNQATITFNEALTPSADVPVSCFGVVTATVTGVNVTGSTVVLTGSGFSVGDVVTYTPPPTFTSAGNPVPQSKGIRDLAGNLAATFSGALT